MIGVEVLKRKMGKMSSLRGGHHVPSPRWIGLRECQCSGGDGLDWFRGEIADAALIVDAGQQPGDVVVVGEALRHHGSLREALGFGTDEDRGVASGDGAIVRVMSPQRAKVCERVWLVAVVVVPVYLLAPAPTQL